MGDFAAVVGRAGKSGAPSLSARFGGSYQRQLVGERYDEEP